MKQIYNYILEKLHLDKDTKKPDSKLLKKYEMVGDPDTIKTIKFVLNFVNSSKLDKFNNSVFHYWDMWINRSDFHCMHAGWSHDNIGYRYSRYVETVVNNYNKRHGTDIKCRVSGWHSDAYDGISILEIKEIVDALKKKYNDFKPDKDKELISINF